MSGDTTFERSAALAAALLYEGYVLYPYRASSLKNRKRFDFGVVYPEGWTGVAGADTSSMRTECVVQAPDGAGEVRVAVRFLHLVERAEDRTAPWHEAVEREVLVAWTALDAASGGTHATPFTFEGVDATDGATRRHSEPLCGRVEVTVERDRAGVFRVAVEVANTTPPGPVGASDRDGALLRALVSTHTLLGVRSAELVSLLDPPEDLRVSTERCRNVGTWPVLVGEPWERTAALSSPIILYDHPRVAPESPGDLFDATEIDEILTLRALTLTEAEKVEAAATDPRVRALLARAERMEPKDLERLHGALRRGGVAAFRAGDRVRLAPKRRADVMDIALAGREATVASVEQDFEGRTYVAVTVDDDPGADLGLHGQPGHRFFFHVDEVERLP